MKFLKPFVLFLVINFGALGLGVLLMGSGPTSNWYSSMNQAPWTPPNWVFGAAWSAIMLCFSLYMTFLYLKLPITKVFTLFAIQFVLNVAWNYIFFNLHLIAFGLATIVALTFIVTIFMVTYWNLMKIKTVFILPYFVWLCIATSLNLYIMVHN